MIRVPLEGQVCTNKIQNYRKAIEDYEQTIKIKYLYI